MDVREKLVEIFRTAPLKTVEDLVDYLDVVKSFKQQGEWVINSESEDGFEHHMCSCCKENAHYSYTFINDYDEGLDGEWEYLGQIENGIIEYLDDYCSNCGAAMKKPKEEEQ